MNEALNQKVINVTPPAAVVDNADFVTAPVDTFGYRYCTFEVVLGALDVDVAALKIQHSDDNAVADPYVDITGGAFVGANLPQDTEDDGIFAIHVDCRGKRRWLNLVLTGGNGAVGTFACVLARLSRGEAFARTAADRGYIREVFV